MSIEIGGQTTLMGVLGKGISYSLSPKIHNYSIQCLGLNHVYVPFDISTSARIKPLLETLWDLGSPGINITVPYKEDVARAFGDQGLTSVNTLYRGTDGWKATSTDGDGFAKGLALLGTPLAGFKDVFILGNGGVTLAILDSITKYFDSMPNTHIFRRNVLKDELILGRLPKGFPIHFYDFEPGVFESLVDGKSGESLVVQATSAPSRGEPLIAFGKALRGFNGVFVEVGYGSFSSMLETAKQKGIPCQDGRPMLLEQARSSQRYWWGKSVDQGLLRRYMGIQG